MSSCSSPRTPAFAIGGVGGSGTRVVARALAHVGCYMGHDLNEAHDNLTFTLLFKRRAALAVSETEFDALSTIFIRSMTEPSPQWSPEDLTLVSKAAQELGNNPLHSPQWSQTRAARMQLPAVVCAPKQTWGWKEPNTHWVIDRLLTRWPRLKYVHVRRNGLDMAYSANQGQLKMWGEVLLGFTPSWPTEPAQSLAYWCAAERRVMEIIDRLDRQADCHVVDFDRLCAEPQVQLQALLAFLGITVDQTVLTELLQLVDKPASVGRFLAHGTSCFNETDLAFVQKLGYL